MCGVAATNLIGGVKGQYTGRHISSANWHARA